ncbi:MAG: hypothetical protein JWQ71_2994 [Pedosphaera sp.]|nr:hypothetical protein [Pedosphaera sp.]
MISSTAVDLPEHRKQAMDACLRVGVFPIAMEHLPATDADAIAESLRMVNEAEIYIGIYGQRYGTVPKGYDISITEMEFNRAVERKLPILIFTMHKDHPITIDMVQVETEAKEKLAKLKTKASEGRIRAEFKSPVELRGQIVEALQAELKREQAKSGEKLAPNFHPPNLIPIAPEPYIAHPYSLLQTSGIIGRQAELNLLTDWVTTNHLVSANVRIFSVVAIGGMGKSALTWKWFNDIAPKELPQLAGRMWWSFYESDAHYENFIIRALAYTTNMSETEVRKLDSLAREDALFRQLDTRPFLLILDGLERILLAYSRMDAAHFSDDGLDDQTANIIAETRGLPDNVRETYLEKHRLRQCADPRAGRFLRRLTQVHASRMLLSTRLYPAELQTQTAVPLPGCFPLFIKGLKDDDALNLWREFKVTGTREQLLPLFKAFGNYPLLLRALAGEVADFRPSPGNFDQWRTANPDFNPAGLPLKNAKTHVLEFALCGLGQTQHRVLHTIAAFRMPATWDTLRALLVNSEGGNPRRPNPFDGIRDLRNSPPAEKKTKSVPPKPCRDDRELDAVLTELEDRGLVGWDKQANRYDLHPIVRGVVWQKLDDRSRRGIYSKLRTFFAAVPKTEYDMIDSLEDMTPAIELYNALLRMNRFAEAASVFFDHLDGATDVRLNASRQCIEMLTPLITQATVRQLQSIHPTELFELYNALGRACLYAGELDLGVKHLESALSLEEQSPLLAGPNIFCLSDLSNAKRHSGNLFVSRYFAHKAWSLEGYRETRTAIGRVAARFGLSLAVCGAVREAKIVLNRAILLANARMEMQSIGFALIADAQQALWLGRPKNALLQVSHAAKFVHETGFERDVIRLARVHGEAALASNDLTASAEHLHHALERARKVNLIEEELPALTALAELHRRKAEHAAARELLDQVWVPAEHGPYCLWHADARNVLAQIECDQMKKCKGKKRESHRIVAIAAATRAYELAWCDGPPFAYHYGLTNAKKLLAELGAPEPKLPPFDASKFEPMPVVDINPKDEFWVDPATLDSNT